MRNPGAGEMAGGGKSRRDLSARAETRPGLRFGGPACALPVARHPRRRLRGGLPGAGGGQAATSPAASLPLVAMPSPGAWAGPGRFSVWRITVTEQCASATTCAETEPR
jgi:hypothetical protein